MLFQLKLSLSSNDNLGLTIRGGREYGLGIYVTAVEQNSLAHDNGIKVKTFILKLIIIYE